MRASLPLLAATLQTALAGQSIVREHVTPISPWSSVLGTQLARDGARGRTLALEQGSPARLWSWNGASWSLLEGAGTPAFGDIVWDSNRRRLVLFQIGTVTEWDGAHSQTINVPGATGGPCAYDESRQRAVIYTALGVREWDGAQWITPSPASSPAVGSYGTAFAYDPIGQRCLLYGGQFASGAASAECWSWDGTTWTQLTANAPPGQRYGASLAHDPTRGRMTLYGGESTSTWEFDGSVWNQVVTTRDPGRQQHAQFVFDGTGMLLGGGIYSDGVQWRLANGNWQRIDGGHPQDRQLTTIEWDVARGEAVLFGGGFSGPSAAFFDDTWTFDGSWHRRVPPASPPPRRGHLMAWSAVDGGLLLYGGYNSSVPLNDTWTWTGANWIQRAPATVPPSRLSASLNSDPNGGVTLFGGASNTNYLGDQWYWNGANWVAQLSALMPGPRAEMLSTYDPIRNVIVLALGAGPSGRHQDTWEWDGAQWRSFAGPNLLVGEMQFRPETGKVAIFEGARLHEWDGVSWATTPFIGGSTLQHFEDRAAGVTRALSIYNETLLVGEPAAATVRGTGCASGPTPALLTHGRPRVGNADFALEVATYAPGNVALIALGLATANQPLGNGCTLLVGNPIGVQVLVARPTGEATMPLPLPATAATAGIVFHTQALVVDPARSVFGGVTLTNALDVRLGQ
ncbi:MAG: hypothetical protein KDE27_24805 [Planctomycetes bacterium]|nr:hypothetical protein [Planctomycetota bacterium]